MSKIMNNLNWLLVKMYKYIASKIAFLLISSQAFGSGLPDFCTSGEFHCQLIGPNSVVAYPVNNQEDYTKTTHADTYYKTANKSSHHKNIIEVDLTNLTWSAYDDDGELIRSGAVSGGKDYCPDIGKECKTVTGTFTIYRKGDEDCKSTRFPVGKGGAPMPYCMFFHGGYALHGSNSVPEYNASHGCIRMHPEDAQWLNEDFVQEGLTQVHVQY